MKSYEEQYYFIRLPDDDGLPSLRPDIDTGRRHYWKKPQPETKPYFFDNAYAEDQDIKNIPWPITPPDILIGGADIVVRSYIREKLIDLEIPNFFMFPSVYIHNDGEWYEDYWYLGFTDELDCWDRQQSKYIKSEDQDDLHEVLKYSLVKKTLDEIPLKDRLLFKMGGTNTGWVTCHEKLMPLFRGDGESGAWLQKVSEF